MRFAVCALVLVACGFKPTPVTGDGGSNGGDDADGGGAGSDAGPMLGPCGTPGAIRDDFDDGMIANQWRSSRMVMETGGELVVTPDDSMRFGGYISKHGVDLTGSQVTVEVTQMIQSTMFGTAAMYLFADNTHYVAFTVRDGLLSAEWALGGAATDVPIAYDPSLHRWWRILEHADLIVWQTSPDGTTWTELTTLPSQMTPWKNRLAIGLGGYSDTPHGAVHFDNLNLGLAQAGWCSADTFMDPFARTAVGFDWVARREPAMGPGCTAQVNNGVQLDQPGFVSRCWLATAQAFDLRHSQAMVFIPGIVTSKPGWKVFLRAISDVVTDAFLVQFDNGQLCAQVRSDPPTCVGYQSDTFLYWRLREDAGTLYFEASQNAASWTSVFATPDPFALDTLELQLGTDATQGFTGGPLPLKMGAYNQLN